MPSLVLLTPTELTRDPRARRAAAAAVEGGWQVAGICVAAGLPPVALAGVTVTRVAGERLDKALRRVGVGGGRSDPPPVRELRGIYRLVRLVRTTRALSAAGRRFEKPDVIHANDFDTLPAAWLLSRHHSARLVYDAHELYAFQEAAPPRLQRLVALALERWLARRADAVLTVSEPVAVELQALLRLPRTPLVVLNCPSTSEHAAPSEVRHPLRVVYQGAIGHGRSVDDLLDAAAASEGVTLGLRIAGVDPSTVQMEVDRRKLADRVIVLEPVDPALLIEALAEFDVGVVVTRPLTRNDELAAPNKFFEYLMAGLAVAVPRRSGVSTIVEHEGLGIAFEPGALGAALSSLAAQPDEVAQMKTRARRVAVDRFNAEAQRPVLAAAWAA